MRYSDIAASARRVGHARRQHPVDRDSKHANPFATVIRCTADGKPDSKTISKWPRALRYVARAKKPRHQLMAFMKGRGGGQWLRRLVRPRARGEIVPQVGSGHEKAERWSLSRGVLKLERRRNPSAVETAVAVFFFCELGRPL